MIASLPMYDRPETAAANDAFWQAIRAHLGQGPAHLTRAGDPWDHWTSPNLLLSQTCGYPYRARLHPQVTLVGTPVYDLDCPPGQYYSAFVVRSEETRPDLKDFADAPFAYNEALSQSGWAAPQNHAALHGFAFGNPVRTAGHRLSALAVAEGRADIAALDALTWKLVQRHDDFAQNLRMLARTPSTPALPYITANPGNAAPLFSAIERAISDLTADTRATLGIKGITQIPVKAYLAVPNPAPPPGPLPKKAAYGASITP